MITDINQDLAQIIKETLADPVDPDSLSLAIAGLKNILTICCEKHGADRAIIWGLLETEEKKTFSQLLATGVTVEIIEPIKKLPSIKPVNQSPSMQSQNCITEMITGKQWQRAMKIARKDELETALGNLGKTNPRYAVIQEFMERVYPEKKNKFPVKKKPVLV